MDISEKTFVPAPEYMSLLRQYIALSFFAFFLPWMIPVAVFAPLPVFAAICVPVLAFFLFMLYWSGRYYGTIAYSLSDDAVSWRRGVWFRSTGIVTYNKITNIDVTQGPLSRRKGVASLKVQTAGYSANKSSAEISINGVIGYEDLRREILAHVRSTGAAPVKRDAAAECADPVTVELRAIRELLEHNLGKGQ